MARGTAKLTPETLGIISRLSVDGVVAKITDGQLDRKQYLLLNDALEALGGKWNRKQQGHVFDYDPAEALDALLLTGQYQTKYSGDFFQTPPAIAAQMCAWAVRKGDRVLEPSAGHGRIVRAALAEGARRVDCIEFDAARCSELISIKAGDVLCEDFLKVPPDPTYDAVVMNPPFSRSADAIHILHAIKFLAQGGRLAAVAGAGVRFRDSKVYTELRSIVGDSGIEDLPPKSFAPDTNVNTVLVTYTKQ